MAFGHRGPHRLDGIVEGVANRWVSSPSLSKEMVKASPGSSHSSRFNPQQPGTAPIPMTVPAGGAESGRCPQVVGAQATVQKSVPLYSNGCTLSEMR